MTSITVTSIDFKATTNFLAGVIDSQLSNTKINNGVSVVEAAVLGSYDFSWGKIIEQLSGRFFVWKFQLSALANKPDGEKHLLQQKIFNYLQKKYPDYSSEYAILVAGLHDHCIFPGIKDDAFIVATPYSKNTKARLWISENLIKMDILKIITTLNGNT